MGKVNYRTRNVAREDVRDLTLHSFGRFLAFDFRQPDGKVKLMSALGMGLLATVLGVRNLPDFYQRVLDAQAGAYPDVPAAVAGDMAASQAAIAAVSAATWDMLMPLALVLSAVLLLAFAGSMVLRITRIEAYLLVSTLAVSAYFLGVSVLLAQQQVADQARFTSAQQEAANGALHKLLPQHGPWPVGEALDPDKLPLSDDGRQQLNRIAVVVVWAQQRYLDNRDSLLAFGSPGETRAAWPLTPQQESLLQDLKRGYETPGVRGWLFGFLLASGLTWGVIALALRQNRQTRAIVNLPSTGPVGTTVGLSEVKGRAAPAPSDDATPSPQTSAPSVWFVRYREKLTKGKNSQWVPTEEWALNSPFCIEDEEGKLLVLPKMADIRSVRESIEEIDAFNRYREQRIEVGDPIYALGYAVPGRRGGQLVLKSGGGQQLLISNRSESELLNQQRQVGLVLLSLVLFSWQCLAVLVLVGPVGLQPETMLVATLASVVAAPATLLVMYFNDMIFLRQRALAVWANVQASLKKRHTLVPALTQLVAASLRYEKQFQESAARLRAAYANATETAGTVTTAEDYRLEESALLRDLRAHIEAHPELDAAEELGQLSVRLERLENEVASQRAGYNSAVEFYNTRITQFPNSLLARLGRLTQLPFMRS